MIIIIYLRLDSTKKCQKCQIEKDHTCNHKSAIDPLHFELKFLLWGSQVQILVRTGKSNAMTR